MTTFEIRSTTEQPTAALRMTRPVSQIGPAMGEAFPKIYHAVVSAGMEPAGMPLARYFDFGEEETTFECAIPVPEPLTASGEVQPSSVGGGEAAFAVHVGPYETIGQTWGAMMAWVAEQGRTPAGPTWEIYVDDPQEVAADQLKTELYVPLA
jgi:effector-binding domain-containing protein